MQNEQFLSIECHLFACEEELNREVAVSGTCLRTLSPEEVGVLSLTNRAAFSLPAVESVQFGVGKLIALAQELVACYICSA